MVFCVLRTAYAVCFLNCFFWLRTFSWTNKLRNNDMLRALPSQTIGSPSNALYLTRYFGLHPTCSSLAVTVIQPRFLAG